MPLPVYSFPLVSPHWTGDQQKHNHGLHASSSAQSDVSEPTVQTSGHYFGFVVPVVRWVQHRLALMIMKHLQVYIPVLRPGTQCSLYISVILYVSKQSEANSEVASYSWL